MRTVIELMYRKGDKKFRYDTRKRQQVQTVIQDLKELKLNRSERSVFDEIIAGERFVSATQSGQQAQQFQITPGIVPPEEQFQNFLEDERYERRQIHPAVAGGSRVVDYSLGMDKWHNSVSAMIGWIEAYRDFCKVCIHTWFKFWFPTIDFPDPKDDRGSSRSY